MDLQKLRAQNKIVQVNDRLGNSFIKDMQGTTKMVYDTLQIVNGQTNYSFFRDSNQRGFPFCNVQNDSLQVGEALSVQRASISVLIEYGESGVFSVLSLSDAIDLNPNLASLALATVQTMIANDVTMKPIPVQHFLPQFNKTAQNELSNLFEFNTDQIIPPQLQFEFTLRTLPINPGTTDKFYLRLIVEGVGSQFNGKTNF